MAKDIECPFCGVSQEINHDDGYGYGEDEMHQQLCGACDRSFGYTTSISFYYEAHVLPCLNGAPHDFKPSFTVPVEYTKMLCDCGAQRKPTKEELQHVMAERKSRYACSGASA